MQLNAQQQEAVRYLGGALFVLAGAGSGKTRVITEKIAYMIQEVGYQPQHIAAITFTNKAAKEMQERITQRLGKARTRGLTVCTFHALGMKILREEAQFVDYKNNFSILDSADSAKIIAEILGENRRDIIEKAKQQISAWKNQLWQPEEVYAHCEDNWQTQMAQLYSRYQATLQHYQAVDFDDLLRLPAILLRENREVRIKWQARLRYLLVDECQDTNACQYALLRLLTGLDARLTVVGDDDQSIYAWRGADMENLRRLQQDYPQLKVIKLEQNYRSTARILRIANQVISHNPKLFPKTLWSQLGEGEAACVVACRDEAHEAEYVVSQIAKNKLVYGADWSDFAILYRGNHQARLFEEALRGARIPYQISGGQSFYDKAEIKDVLAYLRLLANPNDDPAFLRAVTTPKRGIGETTLGKLNEYAKTHQCSLFEASGSLNALATLPSKSRDALQQWMALLHDYRERAQYDDVGETVQQLLSDIQYENHLLEQHIDAPKLAENRWKNVQDLCAWLARKGEEDGRSLVELAQIIALMTLLENQNGEEMDAVKLSTLHAAKGLEYPFVYLVGCEEGLFPHSESIDAGDLAEERRLMYVGITRAKQHLTMTHCKKRKRAGTWQYPEPSRFFQEMPPEDVRFMGEASGNEVVVSQEQGRANTRSLLTMLNQKMGGE